MSNLTDLVPPLSLCKQIPAGSFKNALFEWTVGEPLYNGGRVSIGVHFKSCPLLGFKQYPAPTLQEILLDLPNWSDLTVDFVNPQISVRIKGKDMKLNPSPAAEALKIWLAVKEAK